MPRTASPGGYEMHPRHKPTVNEEMGRVYPSTDIVH